MKRRIYQWIRNKLKRPWPVYRYHSGYGSINGGKRFKIYFTENGIDIKIKS
jgi:hypothetical protein